MDCGSHTIKGINMENDETKRPDIIVGTSKTGYTPRGVFLAIDGDENSPTRRCVIDPSGFHFEPSDFSDFTFNSISIFSPNGDEHTLSFNEDGVFLVDGESVVKDKVTVTSPNGTKYNVIVDDDGNLKTEKEVSNGTTNSNVKQSGSKS